MPKSDAVRVHHILDAARKVLEFAAGKSRADLDADEMATLAILRLIEIMGEAAKSVSEPLRDAHPEIPWRAIGRTRDRLIHAYFDVDADIIWEIVSQDLTPLIDALEQLIIAEGF